MSILKENPLYFSLLCLLGGWLYGHPVIAVVIAACLLLLRFRTVRALMALPLILLISFPRYDAAMPEMERGVIREVHERYVIVGNGRNRLLVYTDEIMPFDAEVEIHTSVFEPVTSARGFYAFDFAAYMKRRGVCWQTDAGSISVISCRRTPRAVLQSYIERHFADEEKACLNQILLHIGNREYEDSFLFQQGFSAAGFLILSEAVLSFLMREKSRNRLAFVLSLLLCLFYHVPFILLQHTVFRFMRLCIKERRMRFSLAVITLLILKPQECTSAAFIVPFIFRLSSQISDLDGWTRSTLVLLYQGFAFHVMNPLQSFLFPFIMKINGICWLLAVIRLFCPLLKIQILFELMERIGVFSAAAALPGSPLGIGLAVYIGAAFCLMRKNEKRIVLYLMTLVFQILGLFHPCAEISFINVGQGDSILIRQPFNTMNMLVDTGKPEMKNRLYDFLQSKGIRKLETLLITHDDSDHSGSCAEVTADFGPSAVITSHLETFTSGKIFFHDLNRIVCEDRNRSSIVLYFRMNGMDIMLMGDADQQTEEDIIVRYGNLSCDILKLSHHGSATGSCGRFLDAVRPRLAIVSSGAYEIYHHPSPQTIKRLRQRKIPWLDTKDEGDITIVCLPLFNLLVTSQGKVAIIVT